MLQPSCTCKYVWGGRHMTTTDDLRKCSWSKAFGITHYQTSRNTYHNRREMISVEGRQQSLSFWTREPLCPLQVIVNNVISGQAALAVKLPCMREAARPWDHFHEWYLNIFLINGRGHCEHNPSIDPLPTLTPNSCWRMHASHNWTL